MKVSFSMAEVESIHVPVEVDMGDFKPEYIPKTYKANSSELPPSETGPLVPSVSVKKVIRIDRWLANVKIYPSRGKAARACKNGEVRIVQKNGSSRQCKASSKV